nr:MAG TPA: hypothetical protein [Caudoviricetes sp.]
MATVVTKELSITVDNAKTYCTADHLDLADQTYAFKKYFNDSTDGYATLNDAAKETIFPSATARPFKADSEISCSRSGGICIVALQFDGTDIHSESFTAITQRVKSKSGITDAALTSSTRSTQIRWHVHGKNGDSQRVKHTILKLYFNQYTMQAIGDGVTIASVSNTSPYQGDSVTFSAVVPNGVAWFGWYSDPACTTLVSTDQSYSVSPESDLTLYAKATKVGSGVYLKRSGAYSEAVSVYKKQNGVWSMIDKSSIDRTKKYELIQ